MQTSPGPLSGIFAQSLPPGFPQPVFGALAKVLQLEAADALYADLKSSGPAETFVERLLKRLEVSVEASPEDLARIPRTGPTVVVSNHPFGLFDGAFLADYLPRIRPDVKVLANSMLLSVPELHSRIIPVDVFGGAEAKIANVRGMREALRWLMRGGLLVAFPAGEVSSLRVEFPKIGIEDPVWSDTIARLLRQSGATAVPLFLDGRNSALFQVAGLIHPRLRTALLPHELLNKQRCTVRMRCGQPLSPGKIAKIANDQELTEHLRWRTYLLHRQKSRSRWHFGLQHKIKSGPSTDEVRRALPEKPLLDSEDFAVYLAEGRTLGAALDEIGRLREITFREAGEGTGRSRDIDEFDASYQHLVLWNKERAEIAGAYRLGVVEKLLAAKGIDGLYTSTLFAFDQRFFDALGPAVELGRSFIRAEYQKGFQPLLLLWKGIGRFMLDNPPVRSLFGPVSISATYSAASRELIASVLRMKAGEELGRFVAPRHPLRQKLAVSAHCDEEELDSIVSDLEAGKKALPVLLRQYMKMGARVHAFNVDPKFGHCLDGLIVVDLAKTERRLQERYFGAEGARQFLNQNCKGALAPLDRPV
jgi:putative hemolysin